MKEVEYVIHEPHHDPETVKVPLLTFVYDIPYLSACGIFPPFHVLAEIFSEGGSQGGMSPGATWKPFSIEKDEYDELWKRIEKTDPLTLENSARYSHIKFVRDLKLEDIEDRFEWVEKACDKHRKDFIKKQNEAFGI